MGFLKKIGRGIKRAGRNVGRFAKRNIRSVSRDAGNVIGNVVGGVVRGFTKPKTEALIRQHQAQSKFQIAQDNNLFKNALHSTPQNLAFQNASISKFSPSSQLKSNDLKKYLPYALGGISLLFGGLLIAKKK